MHMLVGTYETRNGTERNQLGRALVQIYYVALAVPKFAGLFSVVLLYLVVFLLNTVLVSSYL